MAFGAFEQRNEDVPMSEINMIPFIDIMLVLLIIFIVTAPLLTHAVKVNLPKAVSSQNETLPERVTVSIKSNGSYFINGEPIREKDIKVRFRDISKRSKDTQIQLYADQNTEYRLIMDIMSSASTAGLSKIAFVSTPK